MLAWEELTARVSGVPANTYVSRIEPSHFDSLTFFMDDDLPCSFLGSRRTGGPETQAHQSTGPCFPVPTLVRLRAVGVGFASNRA